MEDLLFVLLALISSISRALINVIDRWQFSYKNEDVVKTSFLNNGLPAFVLLSCLILFGSKNHLLNNILSIKACLFGLVMQVVALIFSMALKKYQIYQVTLISRYLIFLSQPFQACWTIHLIWFNWLYMVFLRSYPYHFLLRRIYLNLWVGFIAHWFLAVWHCKPLWHLFYQGLLMVFRTFIPYFTLVLELYFGELHGCFCL